MVSLSSQMAYVLLGEVETALRDVLSDAVGTHTPSETFPRDLQDRLEDRRRREGFKSAPLEASQLIPYLDFQDAFDMVSRHRKQLRQDLASGVSDLSVEVSAITAIRNRVAHNRPLETEDLPVTIRFCENFRLGLERTPVRAQCDRSQSPVLLPIARAPSN